MAITTDITYSNAYRADNLGDVKPKILIGGKTEKFVPNINVSFECESGAEKYWWNLNAKDVVVSDEKTAFAADTISLRIGDTEEKYIIEAYHGDECLKWKRTFYKHPGTNIFENTLQFAKGVTFYRQPSLKELQEQYPDDGRDEGFEMEHYAVYCNQKGNYDGVKYKTGKLGYILPPVFTDAKGNKQQGEIFIDPANNLLRVTIDKSWFEKAEFPVIANDTFGYTTGGASYTGCDRNYVYCSGPYAPAGNGTLTSITMPKIRLDANASFTMGIYDDSGGYPDLLIAQSAGATETAGNPTSIDQDVSASITASTPYWLAFNKDEANSIRFYYDAGDGNLAGQGQTYSVGALTSNLTISSYYFSSRNYSIYGTYTAAGGASIPRSNPFSRPFRQAFGRGGL